ncbi:hypothetical protein GCM10020367_31150 [Streptomyces sannanensis]|uniref:Uncharacterized protein n=1 Tax=Streptomyces sannanensis TaxID=285536 RepID=A0ABP6SCI7_9ACTN
MKPEPATGTNTGSTTAGAGPPGNRAHGTAVQPSHSPHPLEGAGCGSQTGLRKVPGLLAS